PAHQRILAGAMGMLQGNPSCLSLRLAYQGRSMPRTNPDPAQDGIGLMWYSPLVPMIPKTVREVVEMMATVCRQHGFRSWPTFSTVAPGCFDGTLPLFFDRDSSSDIARATECYGALLERGKGLGILPYRVSVGQMDLIIDDEHPFWQVVARIKQALDPAGILA